MVTRSEMSEGGFTPPVDAAELDDIHLVAINAERSYSQQIEVAEQEIDKLNEQINNLNEYIRETNSMKVSALDSARRNLSIKTRDRLLETSEEIDSRNTDEAYWLYASYTVGPDQPERRQAVFDYLVGLRQEIGHATAEEPVPAMLRKEADNGWGEKKTIRSLVNVTSAPLIGTDDFMRAEPVIKVASDEVVVLDTSRGESGVHVEDRSYGNRYLRIVVPDSGGEAWGETVSTIDFDTVPELKITEEMVADLQNNLEGTYEYETLSKLVAARKLLGLDTDPDVLDVMFKSFVAQNPNLMETARLIGFNIMRLKS